MKKLLVPLCGILIIFSALTFEFNINLTPNKISEHDHTKLSPTNNLDWHKVSSYKKILSGSGNFFTKNNGQLDNEDILYYLHGSIGFAKDFLMLYMLESSDFAPSSPTYDRISNRYQGSAVKGGIILVKFEDSNEIIPVGINELSHKGNFFIGKDSSKWRTNVPNYESVFYYNLYDGIDLKYVINNGMLKYDFIVHPYADPNIIQLSYYGVEKLSLGQEGSLLLTAPLGTIYDSKPYIYQEYDGEKVKIIGDFKILGENSIGFEIGGSYDKSLPLIIDPVLEWSTFLGGSLNEVGLDIALDSSGNAYVTGYTYSFDFPITPGAYDFTHNGGATDVYVAKLSSDGSTLLASTYIGSSNFVITGDAGRDIALDSDGNIYVTGHASYFDFPTTPNAYQETYGGGSTDVFIIKLNNNCSVLNYSTFLGGFFADQGYGITVDSNGNAYITGFATSSDFPTTPGAYDEIYDNFEDVFVAKLNHNGSDLIYSTFIGHNYSEIGRDIAIDSSGNAYIIGETSSQNFPTTINAYMTTHNGGTADAFIAKINIDGSSLLYSTFLGGSDQDYGYAIALDSSWNAYLTGWTQSSDFPTSPSAYDSTHNGGRDMFIATIDMNGSILLHSTFFGTASWEYGEDIAIDSDGDVNILGWTESANFPVTPDAYDTTYNGIRDIALMRLDRTCSSLLYSTYFGGSDWEYGFGMAVDSNKNIYITGYTLSSDLPITLGAFDTSYNYSDAFVAKFNIPDQDDPPFIEVIEPGGTPGQIYTRGEEITIFWDAYDDNPLPLNPINISYSNLMTSWISIKNDYPNFGLYDWNTTNVSCPDTYWINATVYDSIDQTAYDHSDYGFEIICPADDPPTIEVIEPGGTLGQSYTQGELITVT